MGIGDGNGSGDGDGGWGMGDGDEVGWEGRRDREGKGTVIGKGQR